MRHCQSAQLKTAPTIRGERKHRSSWKQRLPNGRLDSAVKNSAYHTRGQKCLLIFMIHYKKELPNAGLLAAKRCSRCGRITRFAPQQIRTLPNFMPRTGDRQRNPRALDIHKEGRAVR